MLARLQGYWADLRLRAHAAVPHRARRRAPSIRRRSCAASGPKPWKAGVRRAGDPPDRRPLRREPVPLPALLPVPGDPQAGARGRARPLLGLARGARDRPARSTTCGSSRTTGSSRRSARGASAGRSGRRDGGHAVDVLPAARRPRARPRPGGDHLRRSSGWRCSSRASGPRSTSSGRRASPGATSTARTSASGRPTTSRRRRSTCSCAASTSTRRSARTSSSAGCRCPPTTRC